MDFKRGTLLLTTLAMLALSPAGFAAAPSIVPVQGLLTDSTGAPLEGMVTVNFSLYDSQGATTALWTESQGVNCWMGLFSAYLGSVDPLDLTHFRDQDELWLGIQVSGDSEMPRILIGSTPYSGFAQYSSYTSGEGIVITPANVISSTLGSSIESEEIADGTVTGDDVADGAINSAHIADDTITSSDIANETITSADIANETITSADIENGSILREDLGQDGCTAGQILQQNGAGWDCADPPGLGILSGAINNGQTIPLPAGFTQDRCHWIVSMREGGVQDDIGTDRIVCRADENRVVTCLYSQENTSDMVPATANYLIICQ